MNGLMCSNRSEIRKYHYIIMPVFLSAFRAAFGGVGMVRHGINGIMV